MKLKPWVKNTLTYVGITTVLTVGTALTLPKALDQMNEQQTQKSVEYVQEIKQDRLNAILKDNVIDSNEQSEYNELTGQTSK
jgi:hypothetical protein